MKFGPQYKSILSLTILFWAYNLFGRRYSPHIPKNIIRVFFLDFRFSSRKSQSQQKLAKKFTHFTIQFRSKDLMNLSSLDIENNIFSCNTAKNLSHFTNFLANTFLLGFRKKHLHCIISWRPRTAFLKHFKCKCLYISV